MSRFLRKHQVLTVFICSLIGLGASPALAKAKEAKKTLSTPVNQSSMATIEPEVYGVFHLANKIYLSVRRAAFFIVSPFNGIKKDQEETFGNFADSKRVEFPKGVAKGHWQGIHVGPSRLLLLDGYLLRVALYTSSELTYNTDYSIAWDRIRPARDRNGEPTKVETAKLQARFRQSFKKGPDVKLVGLALAPPSWQSKKTKHFLVATRVKDFPIVTMSCQDGNLSGCFIDRACNVEGHKFDTFSISGIAYSRKRNLILMGDQEKQRILLFKPSSCFNLTFAGEVALPPKIKPINNLQVDEEERLWIATDGKDDYQNASVFTYPEGQW